MGLGALLRRKSKTADTGGPQAVGLPEGAGLFSVELCDPMGHPLPGADVTLTDAANGRRVIKATTDPYGRVTVTLPAGGYTLMGSVEGLQPVHRTVEVAPGFRAQPERVRMEAGQQPGLPQTGVWMFDPPHTSIRFVARHVGMAHVHGRFTRFDGGIRVADRMEDSYIEITIDAASIDTGNKSRDNHLRSPDFLDVGRYPYLHFVSNKLTHRSGTKWAVQGTLTLHGVSRTVSLDTTYLGAVNGGYAEELRCAALATAELHREDYTLNWRNMLARGIAIVGPTVKLEMDIQAMYRNEGTPTPPE